MRSCASCNGDVDVIGLRRMVATNITISYYCNECVRPCTRAIPDVYFDGRDGHIQREENICDRKTGEPIPFFDKRSKAEAMKKAGVREMGDIKPAVGREDAKWFLKNNPLRRKE